MSPAALVFVLTIGGTAWWFAGSSVPGIARARQQMLWAGPSIAGGAAITVLAGLEGASDAFAHTAERASLVWIVAAGAFAACARLPLRPLVRARWPVACAALISQLAARASVDGITIGVPVIGTVVVSEIARLLLIVATAGVISRSSSLLGRPLSRRSTRPFLLIAAFWLVSAIVALSAKDTGAATLTCIVFALLTFLALDRPGPAFAVLGAAAVGVLLAVGRFPHAAARIGTFLEPPTGPRVQQTQLALFASSSGG